MTNVNVPMNSEKVESAAAELQAMIDENQNEPCYIRKILSERQESNLKAHKAATKAVNDRRTVPLVLNYSINDGNCAVIQNFILGSKKLDDSTTVPSIEVQRGTVADNSALRDGTIVTQSSISILSGVFINGVAADNLEVSKVLTKGMIKASRDLIGVTFASKKNAKVYLTHPVWIMPNKAGMVMLSETVVPNGISGKRVVYTDIMTGKPYTGSAKPALNGQWERYLFLGYTPSGVRLDGCLMINTIIKTADSYAIDNRRPLTFLNHIGYGSVATFQAKGDITRADNIKCNARLLQRATHTKDFGTLENVWVLNGKFSDTDGADGQSFVIEDKLIAGVEKVRNVTLKKGTVKGRAVQDRSASNKDQSRVITAKQMLGMVCSLARRGITFTKYGDPSAEYPDMLADENCWKYQISKEYFGDGVEFDVLALVHEISQPTLNIQLVAKLANSQYLPAILGRCYQETIVRNFNFLGRDHDASISEMSVGLGSQALLAMYPEFALQYQGVVKSASATAIDSMFRNICRFNLLMPESKWKTFIGDWAAFFGQRLLLDHEVFCRWLHEGEQVVVVRFPSVHPQEFYTATAVGIKTLLRRIAKLDLCQEDKELLASLVKDTDESSIMTPDHKGFRVLTGGADYDTDKGIVSRWSQLVKAFSELKAHAIEGIGAPASKIKDMRFNWKNCAEAFVTLMYAPKIGRVCNNLTACIELSTMDSKSQIKVMRYVLDNASGTKKYAPHFDYVNDENITIVTIEQAKQAVADMKEADLTDDDTRAAILSDCLVIGKTEVDRTIDAPKTGDDVNPLLNWLDHDGVMVETDLFDHLSLQEKDGKYMLSDTERRGGRLSNLRNSVIDKFLADINELCGEKVVMSDALTSLIASEAESAVTRSLVCLKSQYGAIQGLRRMDKEVYVGSDAMVLQEKLRYSKALFAALTNEAHMLAAANKYDTVRFAKAVLAATATKSFKLGESIDNLFATTLFTPELMRLADTCYADGNGSLYQQVFAVNGAELSHGETLVFAGNFGKRSDGTVVAVSSAKIKAGKYEVVVKDDGVYVTKNILDVFSLPAVNGSFLVNISSRAIAQNGGINKVAELLADADNAVVSVPFVRGQHKDCVILYKAGKEYARLGLAINGSALCKMLDCVSADIVTFKAGVIADSLGRNTNVVMAVLNKNGVVEKNTIRKDEEHEELSMYDLSEDGSAADYEELETMDL